MKKYFVLYEILLLSLPGFGQITISSGAQWVNNGNVTVLIQNMDMANNGSFKAGTSIMKFLGNTDNTIGGSSPTTFYQVEISKGPNNKIILLSNINVDNQVNFTSGFLDLNQKNLTLASAATLNNENENTHIIASNGGEAIITLDAGAPLALNAGNLGAVISSAVSLGSVTIRRGHLAQSGTGLSGSIHRFYLITSQYNTVLNATLR